MQFLFAATLLVSAMLVFAIQPMFGKMVLPLLGGTPAVWNTCMVFYQTILLAGYLYAHWSIKYLGVRRQALVHLVLFCLPWLVLPLGLAEGWKPPPEVNPIPWVLMLLAVSVGLPLFFVSATAPMLQAWFARTDHASARDPYFLYAASNLGSTIALLGYPLLIEPNLSLTRGRCPQTWCWTLGYGLLMALTAACAALLLRSGRWDGEVADDERPSNEPPGAPPTAARRLWWIALAFAPSSLLLGVTTHISTDIAAVPLLWVIPLTLYLLTFVLVFSRRKILPHRWMVRVQPLLVVPLAAIFFLRCSNAIEMIPLHLAAFFVTAMVCHGELAADRPASRYLTEFYIWMSVGGMLGGWFNALLAPRVFDTILEYPLVIALACLLRPRAKAATPGRLTRSLDYVLPAALALAFGAAAIGIRNSYAAENWVRGVFEWLAKIGLKQPDIAAGTVVECSFFVLAAVAAFCLQRRPVRFGLGIAALLMVSLLYSGEQLRPMHIQRSFFGVLRVRDDSWRDGEGVVHQRHTLIHGSTSHGMQDFDPDKRHEPLSYYHRNGPLGETFAALAARRPLREIGVVGLGAGTIACYGEPGQRMTFFEIDPAIERIARDPRFFTYLADCPSKVDVVLGDARLSLAERPGGRFDLLILDAFASDAIPIHLITREALRLYFDKLADDGLLAMHISNRYVEPQPVLRILAEDAGVVARVFGDSGNSNEGRSPSTWVVMGRRPEHLGTLRQKPHWKPLNADPRVGLWTDDFSNIVRVLE